MSLIDLIYPKYCVGCGVEGSYVCIECRKKLFRPDPICPMCCKPSLDGWTHPRCHEKNSLDRLIVGLSYKGIVQTCLKKVKYKSNWDIATFLYDAAMFDNMPEMIVSAVPMWSRKLSERGFNQAEIISDKVAKQSKLTHLVLLDRVRETRPMFGLSKIERKTNISNAFRYIENNSIHKVLLVDDVWTTGSTMRECAKTLKLNGVTEVWGLTLAR